MKTLISLVLLCSLPVFMISCASSRMVEDSRIDTLQKAIKDNPDDATAHEELAYEYFVGKRYGDAISEYKVALQINPNSPMAYFRLGEAYFRLEHAKKAIANYQKAVKLKPDFGLAHLQLGSAYHAVQDGVNAITHTKMAEKLFARERDLVFITKARKNLKLYYEIYPHKPEDFEPAK